ncbi:MAG: TRAP transporter substrate-binding protein [Candidatus Tectomicrobia bacterium]|nr:TRAP transporter substrate-binding protein [Candidatus Tectomicrobia bacterium]
MQTLSRGTIAALLSLALAFLLFPAAVFSAEFTMKCGTPGAATDPLTKQVEWGLKEIEKRSNGRITGRVFPASQLGGNIQMIEQLQLGTLECTNGAVAFLSGAYPPVTIFDLPFVFPDDPEVMRKVLKEGKSARWLLDDMQRVGLKGLAFHTSGYKQFTTNKPVRKLEDMRGIKFRSMTSPILLEQFKSLGANAVPVAFAETYSALQTGVAEGQENPYWATHKMKFFEVQKYLIQTNHGVIISHVLASKKWWDRLPADLGKIVREVFVDAEEVFWNESMKADEEAIQVMKKAGLQFIKLAPEERARFRKATEGVKNVYINRIEKGKMLLDMLEADIASFAKQGK